MTIKTYQAQDFGLGVDMGLNMEVHLRDGEDMSLDIVRVLFKLLWATIHAIRANDVFTVHGKDSHGNPVAENFVYNRSRFSYDLSSCDLIRTVVLVSVRADVQPA